jgi:glycosyltransferase involved in cell wall biosynthesis
LLGASAADFLFAYIGFVYPGKGIETLLRATEQLNADGRRVRLAVIGGSLAREFPDQPNYLETVQTLATELGIDRLVVWTGEYRWDDDLASVYLRSADTCVLPFETGVKLNNSSFSSAAAHGLPIVTTTHSALEPQFVHGDNVFLSEPQDPAALARAMAAVMDDATLRARLGEGASRLARDWYSWDTAMDKTLRLFGTPDPPSSGLIPQSVG